MTGREWGQAQPVPLRRLGLTGSIGAGKSTVAGLLRSAGLTVIDADALARDVMADPGVLAEVAALWPGTVRPGTVKPGTATPAPLMLDRAALAAKVFGDSAQLARLEAITHPRIRAATEQAAAQAAARGEAWVVHDVPLLFEKGLHRGMDAVWVVDAPLELRLERVRLRSGLSREDALAREAAQWSSEQKRALADTLLSNGGTLDDLRRQVAAALASLLELPEAQITERMLGDRGSG